MQKIVIGFTGTQYGMTRSQKDYVQNVLVGAQKMSDLELHHGDCIGADTDMHEIAIGLGIPVIIHPPSNADKRAWCLSYEGMMATKPYIERNHDIVDACNILIATPKSNEEELRSGTWATIRYAKKQGKMIMIVSPT